MMDDNCVTLMGLMRTAFIYGYDGDDGCRIYGAELEVRRRNYRYPDIVPITVSDQIIGDIGDYTGQQVQVTGVLHSNDAKNFGMGSLYQKY